MKIVSTKDIEELKILLFAQGFDLLMDNSVELIFTYKNTLSYFFASKYDLYAQISKITIKKSNEKKIIIVSTARTYFVLLLAWLVLLPGIVVNIVNGRGGEIGIVISIVFLLHMYWRYLKLSKKLSLILS